MDKPEKKFAIVIDSTLSQGQAINLSAHLSAQLGTRDQTLGGAEVVDLSGVRHGGLPICPNVVLATSIDELTRLVGRARELADRGEILLLEYPEEGFTTSADEEYRAAIAQVPCEALSIRGCLLYGPRRQVNALTRGFSLWR